LELQFYQLNGPHLIQTLSYWSYTGLQFNLELNYPLRRHSWQIIGKHIQELSYYMDLFYLLLNLLGLKSRGLVNAEHEGVNDRTKVCAEVLEHTREE
jgi:hypothetical protein